MSNTRARTKKLTIYAMFIALAYVVMVVGRFPISPLPYLKSDPKDAIIVIAGFIYGPMASIIISVIVSLIEMLTVSESGIIGFVMNVVGTCSFACMASLVYKRNRSMKGAIIGLVAGLFVMTAFMLLWNYLLTPLYTPGITRDYVAQNMLLPILLPFNLIKGGINIGLTLLIYKPVVTALRRAKLLESSGESSAPAKNRTVEMVIIGAVVLIVCVFLALVITNVI